MPVISWKSWPTLAVVGCALLAVTACAPNSVVRPHMDPSLSGAEREESRYGTMLRLAASTREAGDPAAAVTIYQQAITLEPSRPDAYVFLGDTLIELQQYDEAAQTYQQALKRDKGNLAAHRGYGSAMLGLNRPEAAIPHYQAALDRDPKDVAAHNGLGVAHDLAGEHEAAQAAYRAGLEAAPDSMLLRNNLGLSLALSGQYQEAIELLRAVADEPGAKAGNRQNLALAYGLSGDLVAAERVSRLDLDEEAVKDNLAYFSALTAIDDPRKRAAGLGVQSPELRDHASDQDAGRRLTAIALQGNDLAIGLAPTGRWFVNLGQFGSAVQASSAWNRLRAKNQDLLGQLSRLAGTQDGPQPLLVGPLAGADEAQALCGSLKGRGQDCRPLAL
jgi:Flp pilus assembly protein TadD